MTIFRIHYMKPEAFSTYVFGIKSPDRKKLADTHTYLRDVDTGPTDKPVKIQDELEQVFHDSQGQIWSPNGEARDLILSKGLRHTSMCVGDVVETPNGQFWVVATAGFKRMP
jgi:hypothetical protein